MSHKPLLGELCVPIVKRKCLTLGWCTSIAHQAAHTPHTERPVSHTLLLGVPGAPRSASPSSLVPGTAAGSCCNWWCVSPARKHTSVTKKCVKESMQDYLHGRQEGEIAHEKVIAHACTHA